MERTEQSVVYLDTNAVLWLFAGNSKRFRTLTRELIRSKKLVYCPLVELEIQYLYELHKISQSPETILGTLYKTIGLEASSVSFHDIVRQAMHITWTRDAFDRMIVAEAQLADAPIVTADTRILKHYKKAVI